MTDKSTIGSEDFALGKVPDHVRMHWFDISLNYTGFVIIPTALMVGVMAAKNFPFWQAVWVLGGGTLVVMANAMLIGYIGYRERTSFALTTRLAFGNQGSRLPSGLLMITSQGWWILQLLLIMTFWPDIALWKAAILLAVFGVVMTATTRTGLQRGMSWLNRIAIPALILLFAVSIYRAVAVAGGWSEIVTTPPTDPGGKSVAAAVIMVAALWINGSTVYPDVARYARSGWAVAYGAIFAFSMGLFGLGLMGLIFYKSLGYSNFGPVFETLGLSAFAFIIVFVQIWTTNQNQMYSSSLAMANALRMKRTSCETILLLISLVITVFLSAYPYNSVFTGFLVLLGLFLTPVPGIVFAEYYVVRRMTVPKKLADLPAINKTALAAYATTVTINLILWGIVPEEAPIGLITLNPLTGFLIHLAFSAIFASGLKPTLDTSRENWKG